MWKALSTLVVSATLTAFAYFGGVSLSTEYPIVTKGNLYESAVQIDLGLFGKGSGVYVGNGFFVTAAHVATIGKSWVVLNGVRIPLVNEYINEEIDVAVLSVADDKWISNVEEFVTPAKMTCEVPQVYGSPVTAVGYPLELKRVMSFGFMSGRIQRVGSWPLVLPITAQIAPGSSGGPLFDSQSRVFAITVGGYKGYGFNIAVPFSVVCDEVKGYAEYFEGEALDISDNGVDYMKVMP